MLKLQKMYRDIFTFTCLYLCDFLFNRQIFTMINIFESTLRTYAGQKLKKSKKHFCVITLVLYYLNFGENTVSGCFWNKYIKYIIYFFIVYRGQEFH